MNGNHEYGFPGCTREEKRNHRRWCYKNGYQPYDLYRKLADEAIERRKAALAAQSLAMKEACLRPEWMSTGRWVSYKEHESRAAKLGFPPTTPEEWAEASGKWKRRVQRIHPAFTEEIKNRFLRMNRTKRHRRKPELTPEQFLKWLAAPKAANGKPIVEKKSRGSRTFTRPKEEIIMKILMAAKQAGSQ